MNYSDEQLNQIYADYEELRRKKASLMESYILKQYRDERVGEYARHGFCRRIQIMAHCIEGVFARLPPNRDERPAEEVGSRCDRLLTSVRIQYIRKHGQSGAHLGFTEGSKTS